MILYFRRISSVRSGWERMEKSRAFIRSIISTVVAATAKKRPYLILPDERACPRASSQWCLSVRNHISTPNPNPTAFVGPLFLITRNYFFLWIFLLLVCSLIGRRIHPACNVNYSFSLWISFFLRNSWRIGKYLCFFKSVVSKTVPWKNPDS